jgi:hypothetical protein
MMNMAHCRFTNTLEALRECYEHIEDAVPAPEDRARQRLLALIRRIESEYPNPDYDGQGQVAEL